VRLHAGDIQNDCGEAGKLRIVRLGHPFRVGHVLFGDVRLFKGTRRCRPCPQWPGARSSACPCNACTHGFCDLCRRIARSDVRARKSCSNVPSGSFQQLRIR
jgi:hypothetical protein